MIAAHEVLNKNITLHSFMKYKKFYLFNPFGVEVVNMLSTPDFIGGYSKLNSSGVSLYYYYIPTPKGLIYE
jgi:hypothetical protein